MVADTFPRPAPAPCPHCNGPVTMMLRGPDDKLVVFLCEATSTCIGSGLGTYAMRAKIDTAAAQYAKRPAITPEHPND